MSCRFPRHTLALYVEGDVPQAAAQVEAHLCRCEECRRLVDELRASQAALKSLRRDGVRSSDCSAMRLGVMALITQNGYPGGWFLRLERAVVLALRPRVYATAGCVVACLVSLSVFAQLGQSATRAAQPNPVADAADVLSRPEGYRNWVRVSPAAGTAHVYVDPPGYRAFRQSGSFPDGTVLLWEAAASRAASVGEAPHKNSPVLLAAVKDVRKYEGGWGFFDFTAPGGAVAARTRALPASSGCGTCHRQGAGFLAYRG